MKKLAIFLLIIFCTCLFASIGEVEGIISKVEKNFSRINSLLVKAGKTKKSGVYYKRIDQIITKNYSLLTKLKYEINKIAEQIGRDKYKKYMKKVKDLYYTQKQLKRKIDKGDYTPLKGIKKIEVVKETPITSVSKEEKVLYKGVGAEIYNIFREINQELSQADSFLSDTIKQMKESGESPRAFRKERRKIQNKISLCEHYLKKMSYLLEKNMVLLKARGEYKSLRKLVEKTKFQIHDFRKKVENSFSLGRVHVSIGEKIKAIFKKPKKVFGKKIKKKAAAYRYVEEEPAEEERYNDKLYIQNNFGRIKKRLDFVENALKKLENLNADSKEAIEYCDEVGYLFRRCDRTLKNVELRIEKNHFIFQHEGIYSKFQKSLKQAYNRLNELMGKFEEYKKQH